MPDSVSNHNNELCSWEIEFIQLFEDLKHYFGMKAQNKDIDIVSNI